MYQLKEYPVRIAEAEKQIQKLETSRNQFKEVLLYMDADIEAAIAFDKELKNEQQRRTKRLSLRQSPDYLQAKLSLSRSGEEYTDSVIQLNLLKNQFSVAKLEARLTIANLEAVA